MQSDTGAFGRAVGSASAAPSYARSFSYCRTEPTTPDSRVITL
jgi:hypothetical protein